jgi:sodium-dependent dicarboxylate transporter 2/3/5
MLPAAWFLLTRVLYRPELLKGDAAGLIETERSELGKATRGEKLTAAVFALTAIAWIMRTEKNLGGVTIPGLATWAPSLADSTIAMIAAVLLFLIPVNWNRGEFVLDWRTAKRIHWDVLVLFGGGLSLARAMEESGLAAWIGGVVAGLGAVPPVVLIAAVTALIVFLTEVTSNTATATMAMPVMAGVATGLNTDPLFLMAAAALAASMAFMLPVATPPNAIVFASGYLTIPNMTRAGFWLNWASILAITFLAYTLIPIFL